jgi:hypothetical protein
MAWYCDVFLNRKQSENSDGFFSCTYHRTEILLSEFSTSLKTPKMSFVGKVLVVITNVVERDKR